MSHQLGTALRVGIRVEAVELVILPVPITRALEVLVHLIGRHVEEALDAFRRTNALKHIDRTHYVRLIRIKRVIVAIDDQRLCREVENCLWLRLGEHLAQCLQVSNISHVLVNTGLQASNVPQARLRGGS